MVANARAGRSRYQIGDNSNYFDFTYLGNIAHAHVLAAKALLSDTPAPQNLRVDGEAFIITNDEPWPFWDVTRAFAAEAGNPVDEQSIVKVPVPVYYILAFFVEWSTWIFTFGMKSPHIERKMVRYLTMNRTFDVSKAKERLGYRPLFGIRGGIQRSVKWYVEQEGKGMK